ncbi:hypothetical protein C0991_006010 [Blastosporella zonata]|nr:hypothetical protein C0991_006010 [Blastosporella zonata]
MQRGFDAFQKNTGSFHPSDIRRKTKRGTGSLELTDDAGILWQGTISVGTPPVDFAVQGDIFSDTVNIANLTVILRFQIIGTNANVVPIQATDQAVGAATQYSAGFAKAEFPPDGLMGMAFPEISDFGANPVFQSLVAQNQTTAAQFSFKLSATQSELLLGGVNTALINGPVTYVPVVHKVRSMPVQA